MSHAALFLDDLATESYYTRQVLAAVPDNLDWQPHERSMTLGRLSGHIAEMPRWGEGILGPDMDFSGMDYTPFVPETPKAALQLFNDGTDDLIVRLDGLEDEVLEQTWRMRMGDTVVYETTRSRALRDTLLMHVAHHRGQLTVYIRLLGVPVPPTYGPTADIEQWVAPPNARPAEARS